MLVWRLNLEWKSGHPNQCLRLGDDAKTDRTLRARFRESASYSSPLSCSRQDAAFFLHTALHEKPSGFSSAVTMKRFPSPQSASAVQIVRAVRAHGGDTAPCPTGFAEIISDDFQYFSQTFFRN